MRKFKFSFLGIEHQYTAGGGGKIPLRYKKNQYEDKTTGGFLNISQPASSNSCKTRLLLTELEIFYRNFL